MAGYFSEDFSVEFNLDDFHPDEVEELSVLESTKRAVVKLTVKSRKTKTSKRGVTETKTVSLHGFNYTRNREKLNKNKGRTECYNCSKRRVTSGKVQKTQCDAKLTIYIDRKEYTLSGEHTC